MFKIKNFNSTHLTQRITFEQYVLKEEGGIHYEDYQTIITTWGHIYCESGHGIHGCAHKADLYTFIVRKSHQLIALKNTIGRLCCNNQVLYIQQFFEDSVYPQFLMGRCFDQKNI